MLTGIGTMTFTPHWQATLDFLQLGTWMAASLAHSAQYEKTWGDGLRGPCHLAAA